MKLTTLTSKATLALILFCLCATAQEPEEPQPNCQTQWRLLAIEAGSDARYDHGKLMEEAARLIEQELEGLSVTVETGPAVELPPQAPIFDRQQCDAWGRRALKQAEGGGTDLTGYDVVFVFGPAFCGAFGWSHRKFETADGSEVRFAWINTRPARYLQHQLELGDESSLLTRSLTRAAERAFRQSGFARKGVVATAVHEFGHFLAPGDHDCKDGYQKPWIGHDGHQARCVMAQRKGSTTPKRILEIALFGGADLVTFCDRCRSRLGLPQRERTPLQKAYERWAR